MTGLFFNSYALEEPVKSISFTSSSLSYENQDLGSFNVTKMAEWIGKGEARITFLIDSIMNLEEKTSSTDLILVLDTSSSMDGDRLEKVKSNVNDLIDNILSDTTNQVALITFGSKSTISSDFTNDKDVLTVKVNNIVASGTTNYYQALVDVDTILSDYTKENDRECIVLFLTDGSPSEDMSNASSQYNYLKSEYPYLLVNVIQYETGDELIENLKKISDNQYIANTNNLSDVLLNASTIPIYYDEFILTDYIDNNYFEIESIDSISSSDGNINLNYVDGTPKIVWTINDFQVGTKKELIIDLKLKEEYLEQDITYSTNLREEVSYKINNTEEIVSSTLTPILKGNYKVMYDANAPNDCTVSNVPTTEVKFVFDIVNKSEEVPVCNGYKFKGWQIVTDGVKQISNNYFYMPESNVTLRAEWGQVTIAKSMDGTVHGESTITNTLVTGKEFYSTIPAEATAIVFTDEEAIDGTAVTDVSSAKDSSVVAWLDSDGITYKVSTQREGVKVIANSDSSWMFAPEFEMNFEKMVVEEDEEYNASMPSESPITSIDLSNLDTGNVLNMTGMFAFNSKLTNLDLSGFDTSKVINMSHMFLGLGLETLNLSSFNTSNVTDMSYMFALTSSAIDLSTFDTSSVTNMRGTFAGTVSVDLRSLDTSNVTDMSEMFFFADGMNLTGLNTENVTTMRYMFCYCYTITNLDLSSFDTSKVEDMYGMFEVCFYLQEVTLGERFTFVGDGGYLPIPSSVFISGADGYWYDVDTKIGYLPTTIPNNVAATYTAINPNPATGDGSDGGGTDTGGGSGSGSGSSDIEYKANYMLVKGTTFNSTIPETATSVVFTDITAPEGVTLTDVSAAQNSSVVSWLDDTIYYVSTQSEGVAVLANASLYAAFKDCTNLTSIDFSNFDTSNSTKAFAMFWGCSNLVDLDLSSFNTSKITDMSYMFYNCTGLTTLNVTSFDTSAVITMYMMFYECSSLTSLNVDNFNTVNVTNMNQLFSNCSSLITLNVSNFDTTNVTDMFGMFFNCSSLTSLDVTNFITSSVIDMGNMFAGCSSLTSLDVTNFDTNNVLDMSSMFSGCTGLTSLDISNFITKNVTDMSWMFNGCSNLVTLDFDVTTFTTSKVTDMNWMFQGCSSLKSLDVTNFDTSNVVDMSYMFTDCSSLTVLDVSGFVTSQVTDMRSMFDGCSSITTLDVANFDTSQVADMSLMFQNCKSVTVLDVSGFNTSNVTEMIKMFFCCSLLTSLDVSNFDTSQVTNMKGMFLGCNALATLNVGNFDTGNVADMDSMFKDCTVLKSIDVSKFNTEKVTNMHYMFYGCSNLKSLNLSNFNTSAVSNMDGIFFYCNRLEVVTLGENFAFVGSYSALPATSSSYVSGADGKWYNAETGVGYSYGTIPSNIAATYVAVKP